MLKMMEKKDNDKGELIDRTAWFTRLHNPYRTRRDMKLSQPWLIMHQAK